LAIFRHEISWLFPIRFPIEIRDLRFGPEEILRIAMAFEAPLHAVRLGVINHWHVIHLPVTARAADAAVHVRGVIVINVIGRAMQLDPLDWLAAFPARPHWLELRVVL